MAKHEARKRFGQNFLHDLSVIDDIVRAIDLRHDDKVIEIGPGLAALTRPLSERLDHLNVIELDRDLAHRLRNSFSPKKLTITEADVLTVDFSDWGDDIRIVGNLPYNISSPLLFHLMSFAHLVRDQHFMLQREVVDRMVAKPGSSDYSRLSVMLQSRYRMMKLFDVSPEAFDPAPKVVSSIVRMRPLPEDRPQAKDISLFEQLVAAGFAQRRKMLRGSWAKWADSIPWEDVGIAPTARPGEVSVQQFIAVADALTERGITG